MDLFWQAAKADEWGKAKGELLLGGRTLIDRAASALSSITNTVYVVGNLKGEITSLPIIQDHPIMGSDRGAIVGLYTALVNANTEWMVVLGCDLPFVTGGFMTRMADIMRHGGDLQMNDVDAVFAEQPDGRNQPLCGQYRRDRCLPEIEKMLSDGEWRLQQLGVRLKTRVIGFSEVKDIQGAEFLFFNMNTPEEYRLAAETDKRCDSNRPF